MPSRALMQVWAQRSPSNPGGPSPTSSRLTIRFDAPVFLSALPATETEHLAFRYVVSIGRSF
ncbi:MAG: hypothetical protein IPL52_11575 [Flavobacteriales bacterium]|nr:hypothetical protein [Flavobacteriales bacterium]